MLSPRIFLRGVVRPSVGCSVRPSVHPTKPFLVKILGKQTASLKEEKSHVGLSMDGLIKVQGPVCRIASVSVGPSAQQPLALVCQSVKRYQMLLPYEIISAPC